jgi:hypothetical protein
LTSRGGVFDSLGIDIVFTQHARSRMADPNRGIITEEEVRSVLANPSVRYTGIDGKQNVLGEVNGKQVRVCFIEEKEWLLVITVINRGTRL